MLRENISVNLVEFRETVNRIDVYTWTRYSLRDVIGDSKTCERMEKYTQVLA